MGSHPEGRDACPKGARLSGPTPRASDRKEEYSVFVISRRVTFSLCAYTRPPLSSEDVERVPRGRPAKVERGLLLGLRHALASVLRGQPEPIAAVLVEVKPVVEAKGLGAKLAPVPIPFPLRRVHAPVPPAPTPVAHPPAVLVDFLRAPSLDVVAVREREVDEHG